MIFNIHLINFNINLINDHLSCQKLLALFFHTLIKRINKSPSEVLSALAQLMFTVKASKVFALIVLTSEEVAKNVGS